MNRCQSQRRPTRGLVFALVLLGALSACVSHTHRIGGGPTGIGETSARQFYVLFGLVAWNDVEVQRMTDDLTSYEVETGFEFVDFLLSPLLLPLTVTSRTVRVRK